jgi:small subunit ribosomal protein S6
MLNHYETVFIVTPVLSETQMKEAVDKFRKVIVDKGGEVVHEENWGLRKLPMPSRKSTGFFYLIDFKDRAILFGSETDTNVMNVDPVPDRKNG